MLRTALLCTTSLWLVAACGVEITGGPADDTQQPPGMAALEELAQCEIEERCGVVSPWDADGLRCALLALSSGDAVRVRVESSNTGDERFWWDLFTSSNGDVQVVYRDVFNEPESNWDDPYDYDWQDLQRCTLATTQIESCLAGIDQQSSDPSCQTVTSWYGGCDAAAPQCP